MRMSKETILKFNKPGPRYTSYPTAPEWSTDVGAVRYKEKLRAFGESDKTLSLYAHLPFCETLCYFCACTMNIRRQDDKYVDEYLQHLSKEIELVAKALGRVKPVRQLHWGGGSPSFLTERQMIRLFSLIQAHFDIDFSDEVAVEVDPRRVTQSKVETLRHLGFNRISIGVQDFDPKVQEAVNRIQPYELVEVFTEWCRRLQFKSVNFDLIYGLPHQTPDTFRQTTEQVIRLRPDRIALYSFAHVPWLKKHQQKIDPAALPDADTKLDIFLTASELLAGAGYESIAMDHFALKEDEMARAFRSGTLYRNFMGYTVKPADEYIGLGVSSIGFLEQAYFQNYKTIPEYYRFLKQGELPVERGKILSEDDRIRQWVIQSMMCRFGLDEAEFSQRFSRDFQEYFSEEDAHIRSCIDDGLIVREGTRIVATDLGKIFIRNVSMGFDHYLRQKAGHKRFSQTV